MVNVNCKHNDNGIRCKNTSVKRSLFGIGARLCCEYGGGECAQAERHERPNAPPPPPPAPRVVIHLKVAG